MASHTSECADRWGRRRRRVRRCAMSNARTESSRVVPNTRGVVYVHCCPAAIAPHVEWALAGVVAHSARLQWSAQPVAPTQLRAEATWIGPIGTAARLAAALRAWPMLV